MDKINLTQKFSLFNEYWNPKIVGELNGQQVKLAKVKGEFVWHKHAAEDELFFVVKGELLIELRDKTVRLKENEFLIVPKGTEHKPVAKEEVWLMLFEPKNTVNTGDIISNLTRDNLEKI